MSKKSITLLAFTIYYTISYSQCTVPKIFFSSPKTNNAVSNIWVMDSSGSNRQALFNDAYYRQSLTIANNSKKMAYTKRKNPNNTGGGDSLWICTANIDGSNEQNVYFLPTFSNTEIRNLDFNSTDTKLLFNAYLDGWPATTFRNGDLFLLDLITSSVTQLTTDFNYAKFNPTFSRNDSLISFCYLSTGWDAYPQPAYTMNLFTGVRQLFDPKGLGTYCSSIWTSGLQYNPQGDKVVFQYANNASGPPSLYMSDTNGANLINLNYTAGGLNQALFSPTGQSIAIHDNNYLKYLTQNGVAYKTISPTSNIGFFDINWVNVEETTSSSINQTICSGQSYLGYSTTGVYKDTLLNSNGCDSIRTLNLTVIPRTYSNINKTICAGQTYLGYNTTGIFRDTFMNTLGCDSIRTLNLTVTPKTYSTINKTICSGQTFLGYSTTGVYKDTLLNSNGCDSIRTLNLTVTPRTYSTVNKTICSGQTFLGYSTTGVYKDTLLNINGCDSVRTLNLTIYPITYTTINKTICAGQTLSGYNISGVYKDTFKNSSGCDSIRTLNLTVTPITYSTINKTICEGQSYQGHTASGIYKDTILNYGGCDSIITVNLTVLSRSFNSITKQICQGEKYFAQGFYQTSSGNYYDTLIAASGCDSILKTQLTVLPNQKPDLGKDIQLCSGDSTILYPGNYKSYLWNTGSTLPRININKQGLYWVQTINSYNCISSDSIKIVAINCKKIEIPNVFSPNGDHINDTWQIKELEIFNGCRVYIFNRWGQRVFTSFGYKQPWNGTYNGKKVPSAVFYYIIDIPEIKQRLSGHLTVLY